MRASPYGFAKSLGSSEKVGMESTAVNGSAHAHVSDRGSVRVSVNANDRVHGHASASSLRPSGDVAGMSTPARRRM